MSRTITITVPHQLPQEEARRRIQAGLEDFRRQQTLVQVAEHWTGNHVEADCRALGQSITGRADVEAGRVVIQIDLPWLLAMLADRIRPQVEERARKQLER